MRPVTRPGSSRSSGHLHVLHTPATTTAPREAISDETQNRREILILGRAAIASITLLVANLVYLAAF